MDISRFVLATGLALVLILASAATAFGNHLVWDSGKYVTPFIEHSLHQHWEPHIAAKRGSADTLAAGTIKVFSTGGANCLVYKTSNTGTSWTESAFSVDPRAKPVSGAFASGGDPVLASYANGTLVYVCLGSDFNSGTGKITGSQLMVYRANSDLSSWTFKNRITPSEAGSASGAQLDKPWIAVDRGADTAYKNRVYLCWTEFDYTNKQTKIRFGQLNLGNDGSDLTNLRTLDSATWTNDNERWKGPYVQGCQIATGPGKAGSGNEIFVAWQRLSGISSGDVRFNANYAGGSTTGWKFSTWSSTTVGNIGAISRYTDLDSCRENVNRIIDGCLSADGAFRAPHLPALAVDKWGNAQLAWTTFTSSNANIVYNFVYNANATMKDPTWGAWFTLTPTGDSRDQWEPAITVFEDSSKRGTVIITYLNKTSSSQWKPYSRDCQPTSNTGAGRCQSSTEWRDHLKISDDQSINNLNVFIGDYHGVASTTSRAAINTFARGEFDFDGHFASYIRSYSGGGGVTLYAEDCSGTYINGMAVNLYDSGNNLIQSGFTPMYVPVHNTGNYLAKYNNYGTNTFVSGAHLPKPVTGYTQYPAWGGDVNLSLSVERAYDVDGIYNTSGGTSCATTGTINVSSIRMDTREEITGLYVQLTNSQGQEIANGFTSVTFTQSAGTYTAYPNDFAPYYFDHWEDNGSTTRGRTVNLAADAHWELTAVYRVQ